MWQLNTGHCNSYLWLVCYRIIAQKSSWTQLFCWSHHSTNVWKSDPLLCEEVSMTLAGCYNHLSVCVCICLVGICYWYVKILLLPPVSFERSLHTSQRALYIASLSLSVKTLFTPWQFFSCRPNLIMVTAWHGQIHQYFFSNNHLVAMTVKKMGFASNFFPILATTCQMSMSEKNQKKPYDEAAALLWALFCQSRVSWIIEWKTICRHAVLIGQF